METWALLAAARGDGFGMGDLLIGAIASQNRLEVWSLDRDGILCAMVGKQPRRRIPGPIRPGRRVQPVRPVPPRRIPQPRRIVPGRVLPRGMTPADLERAIEAAIRFIEERKRQHGASLAWEVGEYLFVHVYREDVEYLRLRHPRKDDSIVDIGRLTGIPHTSLYLWTRAVLVQRLLERHGLGRGLTMTRLVEIGKLVDHPEALRALAEWVERENPSRERVRKAANHWRSHLEEGGRLEDLIRRPEPGPRRRKPKAGRRRARKLEDADQRIVDVLELVREWVEDAAFAGDARREALAIVAGLRRLLGSGS